MYELLALIKHMA